ncbi:hypothetical protein NMW22_29445, partial [Escherichia coli]|nr:hypothetical protein [Escherichia coli]MCX0078628.1 hypothetical protein [Escherichia coli]
MRWLLKKRTNGSVRYCQYTSMFVRFRRAGLSWPLPAGMSEQELDACLYGQFSTVPVVRPEST